MTPLRLLCLVSVVLCACMGCQPWTIVKQAPASSLSAEKVFALVPFRFEGMNVRAEQREHLERGFSYGIRAAGRDTLRIKSHEEADDQAVEVQVVFRLMSGESADDVKTGDAQVRIEVRLLESGAVLDVIEQEDEMSESGSWSKGSPSGAMSLGYLSDEQQLNQRGEKLGRQVAAYIQGRFH